MHVYLCVCVCVYVSVYVCVRARVCAHQRLVDIIHQLIARESKLILRPDHTYGHFGAFRIMQGIWGFIQGVLVQVGLFRAVRGISVYSGCFG